MYIYLCVLFPSVLILCFLYNKNFKMISLVATGIFSATIFCAIKAFFMFTHRLVPFSFLQNFSFYLTSLYLVPVIVVYAVFFLVSKDSLEYKFQAFLPLELSFYTIFFPYTVLSSSGPDYSFFELFVRPTIAVSCFVSAGFLIFSVSKTISDLPKTKSLIFMILRIIFALIFVCLPSVTDSLYAVNTNHALLVILSIIFIILPLSVFFTESFFKTSSLKS